MSENKRELTHPLALENSAMKRKDALEKTNLVEMRSRIQKSEERFKKEQNRMHDDSLNQEAELSKHIYDLPQVKNNVVSVPFRDDRRLILKRLSWKNLEKNSER